jgi:hypothetical protein
VRHACLHYLSLKTVFEDLVDVVVSSVIDSSDNTSTLLFNYGSKVSNSGSSSFLGIISLMNYSHLNCSNTNRLEETLPSCIAVRRMKRKTQFSDPRRSLDLETHSYQPGVLKVCSFPIALHPQLICELEGTCISGRVIPAGDFRCIFLLAEPTQLLLQMGVQEMLLLARHHQ